MQWITFAYSLPKSQSSVRVTLWRRLQRLGAVAPAGNLYVLPAQPQCIEAFDWLTQEIQHKGGQAVTMHCTDFGGMSNEQIIALFCAARAKEYGAIGDEIGRIQRALSDADEADIRQLPTQVAKLRRQYADIARIDYFDCPEGAALLARLAELERRLSLGDDAVTIAPLLLSDFQGKTWRTRPQPHVDRLSSIWLIRRFIDKDAMVVYGVASAETDITFDMPNAQFTHTGNLCTFETLLHTFGISADGLQKLAEIVHEIDLLDGKYNHPETVGVDAILQGWLKQNLSDQTLEQNGLALFDGLLASCA